MAMTDLIPWRRRRNNMQVRNDRDVDDWFGSFHREMNHVMDRFFSGFDIEPWGRANGAGNGTFVPHVDVSETDKAVKVTAELPGMDEKDIDVTLSGDSLIIQGEKKEESEQKDKDFYRIERRYGSFQRVIPLSTDVDESKVRAGFKKGVLKITLPKTAEAQQARKKIEIKTV
jgi:HSP20 family protein